MNTAASPLGAHAFIWAPTWDGDNARHAASQAAAAGFDLIEIPLLDPASVEVNDTVRLLEDEGLRCTCSLGLPGTAHLPHDPDKALLFLLDALHVAAGVGSQWLTGALYGNLGTLTGHGPTDDEFGTIAKILHEVASHAHDLGISLGLEIINRFETYLVNTTSQVIDLLDLIDAPNVYAHLDTFHMNIEEGSFTEPVHRLGSRLGYVHLAESHRGIIGNGHIPFHELFAALRDINYDGPLIIEAFLNADPAIARATASWNTQDLDPETFVSASKAHIDQIRRAVATE